VKNRSSRADPPAASRLGLHDSLPLVPRSPSPAHFLLRGPLTLVSTATSLRSVTGCFLAAAHYTPCPKGDILITASPFGEEETGPEDAERGGYSPIPRRDARAGELVL